MRSSTTSNNELLKDWCVVALGAEVVDGGGDDEDEVDELGGLEVIEEERNRPRAKPRPLADPEDEEVLRNNNIVKTHRIKSRSRN